MIDTSHIGRELPVHSVDVERGRLRFFAKAIGETDAVYRDTDAARGAGHPDIPVPPTFLFCLEMEVPNPFAVYEELGIKVSQILHGEQRFQYHAMAHAGDQLTFHGRITDIYSKKGGKLEFVVKDTEVTNQDQQAIASLRSVIVVRNP
ncbi:MAG: MaoC family dehydratase N-terminal domain-containing protein [Salinisphaeraceae bacterium]